MPDMIQRVIQQIEDAGGSAKICGAGSVRGNSAGMLLVLPGTAPVDVPPAWTPMRLQPVERGTRLEEPV